MKYVVLLCDGCADYPVEELGGKTPLSASVTPNMDKLAKDSVMGMVKTVADGLKPGSDVANLSVLGYDPAVCYTGRSPLEAGSIGIDMKPTDVSFRCNLVTVSDEPDFADKTLVDYCATVSASTVISPIRQATDAHTTLTAHSPLIQKLLRSSLKFSQQAMLPLSSPWTRSPQSVTE